MEEEVLIRFVQLPQVLGIWIEAFALWILRPLTESLDEDIGRRLQVDHEIGRWNVLGEQIVKTLVDEQFVVVEIQIREDLVLVEQIVTHRRLREEISLLQGDELSMPAEEVKELRLQRRARPTGVEVREEWIVGFLQHNCGIEAPCDPVGKRGLT